jgi:PadR family transcriptional regulator, regulatory protein PadR
MNLLDYHVLLALSSGPMHGYAIKDTIAEDSGGTQAPLAGTLYRVIARLMTEGLVRETNGAGDVVHPGHARRYYTLSAAGRRVLADQARQLKDAAVQAERRLGSPRRS